MATNIVGTINNRNAVRELGLSGNTTTYSTGTSTDLGATLSIPFADALLGNAVVLTVCYNGDQYVRVAALLPEAPESTDTYTLDDAYENVYNSLILPVVAKVNGLNSANRYITAEWDNDTRTVTLINSTQNLYVDSIILSNYTLSVITMKYISYDEDTDRYITNDGEVLQTGETLADGTDFDTLLRPGTYYVNGACPNAPKPEVQGSWVIDVCGQYGTTSITQCAYTIVDDSAEPASWTESHGRKISTISGDTVTWTDWIMAAATTDYVDTAIENAGSGKFPGEIVTSTIALDNTDLHIADGSVLENDSVYTNFISYMRDKYDAIDDKTIYELTQYGEAVNEDGVLSNFSTSNYFQATEQAVFSDKAAWKLSGIKIPEYVSSTSDQVIIDGPTEFIQLNITGNVMNLTLTNASYGDITSIALSDYTLIAGNTYYLTLEFTGEMYILSISTDGITYETLTSIESTTSVADGYFKFGLATGGGAPATFDIDISEMQVTSADEVFWAPAYVTKVDTFCTEAEWQASVNAHGTCGKYVYDETALTVRLPKTFDMNRRLIKDYSEGTAWYRVFEENQSDGTVKYWCEQGGYGTIPSTELYITLAIPYLDTTYTSSAIIVGGSSVVMRTSSSTATMVVFDISGTTTGNIYWSCAGYCDAPSAYVAQTSTDYVVVGTAVVSDIVLLDLTTAAAQCIEDINTTATDATAVFTTLSEEQIATLTTAGEEQLNTLNTTGEEYTTAIAAAGEEQTSAVTAAGEAQSATITTTGDTAVAAIETAGDEQLAKILVTDGTRSPFELVASTSSQADAGLHLADGTVLETNVYGDFINLAKAKAEAGAEEFTTEEEWQAQIDAYGVCGKYVYNAETAQVWYGITEDTVDEEESDPGADESDPWEESDPGIGEENTESVAAITAEPVVVYYLDSLPTESAEAVNLYDAELTLVASDAIVTIDAETGAMTVTSETLDISCTRVDDTADITITTPATLRIPLITGFLEGTLDDLGGLNEAGLPNITGELSSFAGKRTGCTSTGALEATGSNYGYDFTTGSAIDPSGSITLDASLSNSIYGNSDTVQPQAVKIYYYIVVGTQTTSDITVVDITEAGEAQIAAINATGETNVAAVTSTGETQIAAVAEAGETQVSAIAAKGEEAAVDLQAFIDENDVALADLSNASVLNETIVEEYSNGTEWYIIYKRPQSDGTVKYWCEQGGRFYNNSYVTNTITLYTAYLDTAYQVLINHGVSGAYMGSITGCHTDEPYDFTTTSFKAYTSDTAGVNYIQWIARGYCDAPTE